MSSRQTDHDSAIANNWKKETLDLVNIEYDSRSVADFKFDALVLPDELQKSMTRFIKNANSNDRSNRQELGVNQRFEGNNLQVQIHSIPSSFDYGAREILSYLTKMLLKNYASLHPR